MPQGGHGFSTTAASTSPTDVAGGNRRPPVVGPGRRAPRGAAQFRRPPTVSTCFPRRSPLRSGFPSRRSTHSLAPLVIAGRNARSVIGFRRTPSGRWRRAAARLATNCQRLASTVGIISCHEWAAVCGFDRKARVTARWLSGGIGGLIPLCSGSCCLVWVSAGAVVAGWLRCQGV